MGRAPVPFVFPLDADQRVALGSYGRTAMALRGASLHCRRRIPAADNAASGIAGAPCLLNHGGSGCRLSADLLGDPLGNPQSHDCCHRCRPYQFRRQHCRFRGSLHFRLPPRRHGIFERWPHPDCAVLPCRWSLHLACPSTRRLMQNRLLHSKSPLWLLGVLDSEMYMSFLRAPYTSVSFTFIVTVTL